MTVQTAKTGRRRLSDVSLFFLIFISLFSVLHRGGSKIFEKGEGVQEGVQLWAQC